MTWSNVVTGEITEHWNAESLEYVVHVEQRCEYLEQVTYNVVPPHLARIPTPATVFSLSHSYYWYLTDMLFFVLQVH